MTYFHKPRCSLLLIFVVPTTLGELLLVTVGLVLYFGDMLACTIAKVGLSSTDSL